MKHNNKFIYPKTVREAIDGKRHYNINDKEKLPSVTTILSKTSPKEKEEGLRKWREKMGEENAARIVNEAAARGCLRPLGEREAPEGEARAKCQSRPTNRQYQARPTKRHSCTS